MKFMNSVHSFSDGGCAVENQSFGHCDMIFLSISMIGYESKAILKPSAGIDPCCICQKEFSRQMRIANHVAIRNKKSNMKKNISKPAKADKEDVYMKLLSMKQYK